MREPYGPRVSVSDDRELTPPAKASFLASHESGVHEFEQQAVDAEHHQVQHEARVADHGKRPVSPIGFEHHDRGLRGGQLQAGLQESPTLSTRPSSWRSRSLLSRATTSMTLRARASLALRLNASRTA